MRIRITGLKVICLFSWGSAFSWLWGIVGGPCLRRRHQVQPSQVHKFYPYTSATFWCRSGSDLPIMTNRTYQLWWRSRSWSYPKFYTCWKIIQRRASLHCFTFLASSVVDPECFFSDPDPTFQLVPDPDPVWILSDFFSYILHIDFTVVFPLCLL